MRWSIASLGLAAGASVLLTFARLFTNGIDRLDPGGGTAATGARHTLLQAAGASALAILLIPVALTALPVLLRTHPRVRTLRMGAVVLLLPILPIGYFTIGGLYIPSAIAMLVACRREPRPARAVSSIDAPAGDSS